MSNGDSLYAVVHGSSIDRHQPPAIKPIKPQSPEQMRISNLKANVDRQKDALKRERDNQKRQREAEHRWRNLGGI